MEYSKLISSVSQKQSRNFLLASMTSFWWHSITPREHSALLKLLIFLPASAREGQKTCRKAYHWPLALTDLHTVRSGLIRIQRRTFPNRTPRAILLMGTPRPSSSFLRVRFKVILDEAFKCDRG